MTEIRFQVTEKLHDNILKICDKLGISKSDYVKNLIIADLRKQKEDKKK